MLTTKGKNTEYKRDKHRLEQASTDFEKTNANIKRTTPDHKADKYRPKKRKILTKKGTNTNQERDKYQPPKFS